MTAFFEWLARHWLTVLLIVGTLVALGFIYMKRSSFSSKEALEERIAQFIVYYNTHLAKPFKWTFDGKLLKV